MDPEYILYFISLLVLFFAILIAWYLSFSVPSNVVRSIDYLWTNLKNGMITYYLLLLLLTVIVFCSFWYPTVVKFHVPFSQPGIFLIAVAILLLSGFFIDENFSGRRIDTHPLLFQTSVFLIILAFATGIVTNIKLFS